ncbi:YajG family lipoprotein [Pasteurella testudinis]|uniref:YajG family lipoprotein n=1 Tax=Pasteurella testudinis TaxID=761 RepID=UPI004058B91D
MKKTSLKALSSALLLGSAVLLAGCQTQNNTLTFTPPAPSAQFNTANQRVVVNVVTQDQRATSTVASYTSGGNVQHLTSSPEVAQLFQQVVQQGLNSKGFRIASGTNSNSNVVVRITDFSAQVTEGNLKYKIDSKVNVVLEVQGAKGTFSKSFGATNTQEGVFGVNNEGIQKIINRSFQDVVTKFYNDNEVSNALLSLSN